MGTKGSRIHEKWNLLYMKSKNKIEMTRFLLFTATLKRTKRRKKSENMLLEFLIFKTARQSNARGSFKKLYFLIQSSLMMISIQQQPCNTIQPLTSNGIDNYVVYVCASTLIMIKEQEGNLSYFDSNSVLTDIICSQSQKQTKGEHTKLSSTSKLLLRMRHF